MICLPLNSRPTTPSIAKAITLNIGVEFSCIMLAVGPCSIVSFCICGFIADWFGASVGVIVDVRVKVPVRVGVAVGVKVGDGVVV